MKRYYAVLIFFYTIFLLYMMFYGCGRHPEFGFLQLNPFHSIQYFLNYHQFFSQKFMVNILGNILVFIPYGWLSILDKRLNNLPLLFCLFISWVSMIELAQLYTARGTADIDDVFLNTFGMLIGYFGLKLATWLNIANIRLELGLGYREINSYSYNQ
ncbi:glycopeptide antibiotics resistance protein [Epilithonimonas hungarica]|uniref:VanZ family protein n=1 Tax=Epilithonimonas hungarica TaxID=454006 RepID=UPI0027870043|nr:VanZ family protein [Epilithonimonas hungarica]MDP9957418.1 glycopeptide antibiotics resistance protein [Epilithonimonas hungarica]